MKIRILLLLVPMIIGLISCMFLTSNDYHQNKSDLLLANVEALAFSDYMLDEDCPPKNNRYCVKDWFVQLDKKEKRRH